MEITGTLVQVNEPITGQGKNGMWKKQEFIIETPGQYPKKVIISTWGDKINLASLKPGTQVTVGFDLESREYNGRWYTEVKAWKVAAGAGNSAGLQEAGGMMPPPPVFDNSGSAVDDDLPF